MPNRAVEYVPWRRMDAERPVQSDGIPGVVSEDRVGVLGGGGFYRREMRIDTWPLALMFWSGGLACD